MMVDETAHEERPHSGRRNLNPADMSLWALLAEDYRTHERDFLSPGFIAIAVHRFGNWRMSIKPRLLRIPFSFLYRVMYRCVLLALKIELPYTVPLGRRVRIWHHGGMVLGAASIGNDVVLRHHVTIGLAHHHDPLNRLPVIEDLVEIGCGAVVLGAVRVGRGSVIGANSVVTHDVPPATLVVGAPAKVVRTLGGRSIVNGDSDPPIPSMPHPPLPPQGESSARPS